MLTFDRSLGPDQSSAFVGSDLNGQANLGFQVEESPRPDVLNGRAALTNTIRRDGVNVDVNGDGISDTPFDIATAQGQAFTLNPGESAVYDVGTTVGENQPSDIQSAPSNLEATAVSDSEIRLRFVDNSVNETGFEVERQADFGPFSLLTVLDADDVTYRDTGLAEGVTYTYRVRARLAGGRTTADSNEAEATTMLRAPTGLDAIATSPTTVTLAWSDNSDAESGYIIERCTLDGPFEVIDSTGPNESSYQDFDLTPDTTYCYRVKAFGAGSESDYSNVVFVTTSDAAPEAPTNLRASLAGAVTVVLSWEDNSASEEGFNIERRTEDGDFGLIDTVNADVTQYIDTGLTPGTTYVYRVQAFSSGGESEFSNEASVTTAGGGTAGPEDLRVTGVCETIIFVEWEDVSEDESGFEIERRSGNEDFERVGRVGADVTRFTDTGLARSTRYTYRVRAVRGNSFSEFSNEDSGATLSGVSGGTAQITPRKLSFSRNAGAKPLTKQVVIKNVGKQTLAGVVYKLSAPYKILSGAGGFALKPGKSLTVTVEFTPGVSGKTSSSLTVYSTDRKTSLVDVPVALQK